MSGERTPANASEVLRHLNNFLEYDEQEISNVPIDELQEELCSQNIDINSFITEVKNRLSEIKSKEKLEIAHVKRLKLLKFISENLQKFSNETLIKEGGIITKIRETFGLSEEEAMVYCRKFDSLTDQDKQSLLSDLQLLDELEGFSDVDKRN